MSDWSLSVRVDATIYSLMIPTSDRERLLYEQAKLRVEAMGREYEQEIRQKLADRINAEIDLARAALSRT